MSIQVFLQWLLGLYVVHVLFYLLFGYVLNRINRFFPDRCIQPEGIKVEAAIEIRQAFFSLLAVSICIALALCFKFNGWQLVTHESATQTGELWHADALDILGYFLLLALIGDFWFYWEHRLMHIKPFTRLHRIHHLSRTPTPWSNDRFSFWEVLLIQAYIPLLCLILPVPVWAILLHRGYDQIKGMIGHGGFEYFAGRGAIWPGPFTCVTHHDRHHERYSVNFGNMLTIWDRLFGTLESGYDDQVMHWAKRGKTKG